VGDNKLKIFLCDDSQAVPIRPYGKK